MQGARRCLVVLALAGLLAPAASSGQGPPAPTPSAKRPIHIADTSIRARELRHWQRIVAAQQGVRKGWRRPSFRRAAATLLIETRWVDLEAAELGVGVSGDEVLERFRALRSEAFPRRGDYAAYLRRSRATTDDILRALRTDMLATRIYALVTAGAADASEAQRRIVKYRADRNAKWLPRTTCTRRWRVPGLCA